jgi:SDR family mycofactocin-dependent oxidoreductase
MGKLDGTVAFITGAARGQGRCHAIRLADEGAAIIAVDICRQISSIPYPLASSEDLRETAAMVQAAGGRIFTAEADVRDEDSLATALGQGIQQLGPIDIVVANAGVAAIALRETDRAWQDSIDVNLTGVMNTVEAAAPAMIGRAAGGAIVLTSSTAGLAGFLGGSRGSLAYTASKHGVIGLMRSYANVLAPHSIRVNCVVPTGVNSPMVDNDAVRERLAAAPSAAMTNALPVQLLEPEDVSNAVAWLVSAEARYVTGVALPVDAGFTNRK